MEFINIYNKRMLLWDKYAVDEEKTTAILTLNHPTKKEIVIYHDEPWEGDCCCYHNIFRDGNIYRMYYLARDSKTPVVGIICPGVVCYAESRDGIHWKKPSLGICEHGGTSENNIILDGNTDLFDNFYVLKDDNPDCLEGEQYKGVAVSYKDAKKSGDETLWCYTSSDGIHFQKAWEMTKDGHFDSLNIALWDSFQNQYVCYMRGYHENKEGKLTRDIGRITSKDFKIWSKPELLDFQDAEDVQLYTNCISKYYRGENMYVGFPTRYTEREEWTENYDQLCGAAARKALIEREEPRSGLALTDCLFMTSHDGKVWHRFDEAFLTAGPERKHNWIYGDCYVAAGMFEVEGMGEDEPNELSLYVNDGHHSQKPTRLYRYSMRIDGFASYTAPYRGANVVTKPFLLQGENLEFNFKTSAGGGIYVRLLDEQGEPIPGYETCEIFGDALNRKIIFPNYKNLNELIGKKIRIEFVMRDASLYSFIVR